MRKDPTEFRERFAKWKAGDKVYEAGLPKYNSGKEGAESDYERFVDNLIQVEGYNEKPTDIGDGKMTLGSGLTGKKWHDLYKKRGNVWSRADNRYAVKSELDSNRSTITNVLPEYNSYPEGLKRVLDDIQYNTGAISEKLSPKFVRAMREHNWEEAINQMDWGNNDPVFGGGLRKRNAWRAAEFRKILPELTRNRQIRPISFIREASNNINNYIEPVINTVSNISVPKMINAVSDTVQQYQRNKTRRQQERFNLLKQWASQQINNIIDFGSQQINGLSNLRFPLLH